MGITKQDLAALRTCNKIVVRYDRSKDVSRLEAIKDADDKNPWEQTHVVAVETDTTCYEDYRRVCGGFALLSRYSWEQSPLRTFLDLLRVDDGVSVKFVAGNNSDYLRNAGLHHDQLYFKIVRGKKVLTFLVETSVCPDNLARMCKLEAA